MLWVFKWKWLNHTLSFAHHCRWTSSCTLYPLIPKCVRHQECKIWPSCSFFHQMEEMSKWALYLVVNSWSLSTSLTPKCCWHHFVDDRGWQWQFLIHWFLGQLIRPNVHHIQLINHHGRSFSFCKNEFCKEKIDDQVVYFKFFAYIC
jgi:hypothetical protein